MEWSDTALVLHVGRFRESDIWLRVLSHSRGIINVFAFGGSRSRKRFCGCLDLLNTLSYRVKSSNNGRYLAMQEGVLLHGPTRLRTDWTRLGMAMNCVRFMDVLGVAHDGAPQAFALLASMLECLETVPSPSPLLPVLFRLRLASDQGFAPAFDMCASCKTPLEQGMFLVDEAQLFCAHCAQHTPSSAYAIHIPPASLDLLRMVQHNSPEKWHVDTIHAVNKRVCARTIDGFVQYHLGIAWDNGKFRRV